MHVCMYVHTHTHTHDMHVCVYVCMYVYICAHTQRHIHTDTRTQTPTFDTSLRRCSRRSLWRDSPSLARVSSVTTRDTSSLNFMVSFSLLLMSASSAL